MLEKPPAATTSELSDLTRRAAAAGRVLMTTWHSQHNAAVDEARRLLAGRDVARLFIDWKEDVRKWHPGQRWIFEPGGFGVFDPGINALSIVTRVMPRPVFLRAAELLVPENADAPIAATLTFDGPDHRAEFDWRREGGEVWEIEIDIADGPRLKLADGGTRLLVDGIETVAAAPREYQALYARFAELLRSGESEIDAAPFLLAADAFLLGRRRSVEAFHDNG
jgi:D-galactose 1-dehydrogenase